jgi:hypothetical protein
MRWCARCGVSVDDGLLLCASCVPREKLGQSVTIEFGSPPRSTAMAYELPNQGGKHQSRLRAIEKVEWIHDRQRQERVVRLFDHHNRLYRETCFDLETGVITWGPKYGPLDDQSIHGRSGKKSEGKRL